jgi:hypothetical protein
MIAAQKRAAVTVSEKGFIMGVSGGIRRLRHQKRHKYPSFLSFSNNLWVLTLGTFDNIISIRLILWEVLQ